MGNNTRDEYPTPPNATFVFKLVAFILMLPLLPIYLFAWFMEEKLRGGAWGVAGLIVVFIITYALLAP